MFDRIYNKLRNKKILVLGLGMEGRSSLRFLSKYFPDNEVAVADSNPELLLSLPDELKDRTKFYTGNSYLDSIDYYDIIIKSPGIPTSIPAGRVAKQKISSQTGLFLTQFREKTIGITGTKGKSTTSSLIFHILSKAFGDVHLTGNIGIPPFDIIEDVGDDSLIVFEMSSHQLENTEVSPHIAVLLNLFEEHLDHYIGLSEYHSAKLNITRFQDEEDILIFNSGDNAITKLLNETRVRAKHFPFSLSGVPDEGVHYGSGKISVINGNLLSEFDFGQLKNLAGDHNLLNVMAAIAVAKILGADDEVIRNAVPEFKSLPHRLEFIGEYSGIYFYDDSIATIPEATIEAVKTLKKVDTLILGGKDRGIDYSALIEFISVAKIANVIFTGDAGRRIYEGMVKNGRFNNTKLFFVNDFYGISEIIKNNTKRGSICLLSPAASSYDEFGNFKEKGDAFKKIAENL